MQWEMYPGRARHTGRRHLHHPDGQEGRYVSLKMPSGEVRRILSTCKATIGTTSNPDHGLPGVGQSRQKALAGRLRTAAYA